MADDETYFVKIPEEFKARLRNANSNSVLDSWLDKQNKCPSDLLELGLSSLELGVELYNLYRSNYLENSRLSPIKSAFEYIFSTPLDDWKYFWIADRSTRYLLPLARNLADGRELELIYFQSMINTLKALCDFIPEKSTEPYSLILY